MKKQLAWVTDYGVVFFSFTDKKRSGAVWRRDGMPTNKEAWILRDFLTYFTFDCFKSATDPNVAPNG